MSEEATTTKKCQFVLVKNTVDVEFDRQNCVLQWKPTEKKKKDVTTQISVRDVIGTESDDGLWTVHYVTKTKKKWSANTVTFKGEQDVCQQWTSEVNEAIAQTGASRPKRPLVFINPDGGKKTGIKDYHSKVAPLFEKAGITAEVIVTEDGGHAQRVLDEYDLTTIDSVIAVGGDGTTLAVVSALERRLMKDAEKSVDDEEPVTVHIPIGTIPSGSANGLVKMVTGLDQGLGVSDAISAALFIILGYTTHVKLFTLHNNKKLLSYGLIFLGSGLMGESAALAEADREGGPMRYLQPLLKLLWRQDTSEMNVQYLTEGQKDQEWQTFSGRFVMTMTSLYKIKSLKSNDNSFMNGPASIHTLDTTLGRWGCFKHMMQLAMQKGDAFNHRGISLYDNITAIKYDIPTPPDDSSVKHHLNVDGESVTVEPGEIMIRIYRKRVKMFGQIAEPPPQEGATSD